MFSDASPGSAPNIPAMKITFEDRIEAIEWIADFADDEGQFEVLREKLQFNYIYYGTFFLDLEERTGEVVLLNSQR